MMWNMYYLLKLYGHAHLNKEMQQGKFSIMSSYYVHGLGAVSIIAYFYFLGLKKNTFSNRAKKVISKKAR